ncbi:MAG TPA: sigma-70 family RNA polymerase sigma factor [Steroidobacteraceae bacterium]|jgi:RNA polymerase sigma-70 factor (ECF subfamily)|nr:sigma-70 family RNA polymerase sigma factor [Steroidobacteraceae bacterium]
MRNIPPEVPVPLSDTVKPAGDGGTMALERLFASLRPELLRFAWWLARDRAVAEDVVQEALLRAWRSRDSLKDPAAARGWLLTIVRREHARLYERKRLEITDLDEVIAAEDSQLGTESEELVGLRLAITQLPEEYRVPLVMQVLGGFTTDEIARELTLSTAAVLTRLFRARNRLRRIYGLMPAPDGMDEPAV